MSMRGELTADAGEHNDALNTRGVDLEADRDGSDRAFALLVVVAEALTSSDSFEDASSRLLRDLAGVLDLAAGTLWLPVGETLVASTVWAGRGVDRNALERALRRLRLSRGASLPGSAWERREPLQRSTSAPCYGDELMEEAAAGLLGRIALPVCSGQEVLGVIELYSASNAELSERITQALDIAGQLLGTLFSRRRGELKLSPLTARELEVLALAAGGFKTRGIAEGLEISPATVKTHFEHIFRKLAVSDRTAAVAVALRGGLIG
jgi:DNA-binding CsgD family transcriptional regulator